MSTDYVLVSVYDKKASNYSPVVAYPSRAAATRAFFSLLCASDSVPSQWPDDFDLYELGGFDQSHGFIQVYDRPVFLISGRSALDSLLQSRQERGGAVGGVSTQTPPEDSEAGAERNTLPDDNTPPLPGLDASAASDTSSAI